MSKALIATFIVCSFLHITLSQQLNSCKSVHKTPCSYDSQCLCYGSLQLICNFSNKCRQASFLDKIIRRQPCWPIFKSRCNVDEDCPCKEAKLMCEHHECVRAKPKKTN